MAVTPLNTRRKEILQAVVKNYIETAIPVSSQTIARRLRTQISSATVRNIMAELDEIGLIYQPHTSAGRIPTDKGYRYYIDSLLEFEQLTPDERRFIEGLNLEKDKAFDDLLTEILRILSKFSGYTAVAFSSGLRRISFKKLDFIPVQKKGILVVLVSSEGLVKTAVVHIPYKLEKNQLEKIAQFLNSAFEGLSLDEVKQAVTRRLLTTRDSFFYILKMAAQILELAFTNFEKDKLYLTGTSYILEQPEFQNAQKLYGILQVFEKQEPLLEIMRKELDSEGVKIHIGKENPCTDMQECSLIISNFKVKDRSIGSLGILGPRRMFYPRAISTVSYMAQFLSRQIADFSFR